MTNKHDIIRKPVITEKSMTAMAEKKYTFIVQINANKVSNKKSCRRNLRR